MSDQSSVTRTRRPAAFAERLATRIDWVAIGAILLLALFLSPALHGAFRGDDTWNSVIRGQMELNDIGLPRLIWDSLDNYLTSSGRPNVLAVIQGTFVVWLFDQEVPYHAYLVAVTLIAAGVLYALARELGLSRWAGLLVITLLAGAIQFRSYHDGLLGYSGTIQITVALMLGSVLFFMRALRRDDRRLLILSVLLFLPCPLLYEGTYTLVAVHLGVALVERRGWAAVRVALPFLVIGAAFVVLSYILRLSAPSVVPGYEVGSSPMEALRTYFVQLFAPLPASNLIFKADYGAFFPIGGNPTKPELLAAAWRGLAVFAVVLLVALHLTGRDGGRLPSRATIRSMAVIGGLLWVSSIVIISLAPKYQTELVAGRGHLPVVVQVFGWALVAAAVLFALLRSAIGRSRTAVLAVAVSAAGLLGLGAGMVGFNNMRVIGLEAPVKESRALLEDGADAGVFANVETDGSLLFSYRDLGWPTGRFNQVPDALESLLINETDRRYDGRIVPPPETFDCPTSDSGLPADCEPPDESAAWVRVRPRADGGSVVVASVPDVAAGRAAFRATTQDVRTFVREDNGAQVRPPKLVGVTERGTPWTSSRLSWRRVAGGGEWAVYDASVRDGPLPVASTLDDPRSNVDFTALGGPDRVVRIYGTSQLLP
jgi:hypothetical protein